MVINKKLCITEERKNGCDKLIYVKLLSRTCDLDYFGQLGLWQDVYPEIVGTLSEIICYFL